MFKAALLSVALVGGGLTIGWHGEAFVAPAWQGAIAWYNYDPGKEAIACLDRNNALSDRLIAEGVAARIPASEVVSQVQAQQENCDVHVQAWARRDGKEVVFMAIVANGMAGAFRK